jgi:holo-[acyl-carrier protein] synthase
LDKADVISRFLAGRCVFTVPQSLKGSLRDTRFAAKEACRKACQHLSIIQTGFKHIMILPVTSMDRSKHQSSRPQGLILDQVYEDFEPVMVKPDGKIELIDLSKLDGQLCEISISHDGDYATAVAIVPIAEKWKY